MIVLHEQHKIMESVSAHYSIMCLDITQDMSHGKRKLQCHNFVNNADAVPRFLGGSLNAVHQAVESYAPSMSVRAELPACCLHVAQHSRVDLSCMYKHAFMC